MTNRRQPEATVHPVHFEDRSGTEFERLCFAYLLQAFEWKTIDWYGQLGGDAGRDIWGVRPSGEAECFQCANHRALKFKKAEEDLAKVVVGPNGLPTKFTLITGGKVSADMRDRVIASPAQAGTRVRGFDEPPEAARGFSASSSSRTPSGSSCS